MQPPVGQTLQAGNLLAKVEGGLERRDLLAVEPRYRERGLSAMHTAAYRLLHGPDGR